MALSDVTKGHRYLTATSETKTPGPALVAEVQGRKLKRSIFRGAVRRGSDLFGDLKSNLDNYACKTGPLDSRMRSRDK